MTVTIAETRDIALCRALRRTVFIDEQGVSEADELDDLDEGAIHLLAQEGRQAIGSARLLVQGDLGKIGRVCVLAPARGRGIGAGVERTLDRRFDRRWPRCRGGGIYRGLHHLASARRQTATALYGPFRDCCSACRD